MRPQSRLLASAVTAALVLSSVACTSGEPTDPQPSSPAATVTPTPTPSPTPTPTPTPSPTRKAPGDPLTGLRFSSNGVYAVKIDNVAPARPQVGISKADIIVAEEVEASLTRLVAIFHSSFPSAVGPVRSARNTDVEFLPLIGKPGLVYSGANRLVQANVRGSEHLVPIERSDRDYSRPAPHNVVVNLAGIAEQHPVAKASDIGWTFAKSDKRWKDADESGDFSEQVGGDTFSFTRTDDGYHIAVNGDTYDDAATGKNLVATNIVVLSVVNRPDTDTTSSISIVSDTTGEGAVTITRDGKTRTGTWKRESPTAPMTFTDSDGKPINLKPGKTWLLLQG